MQRNSVDLPQPLRPTSTTKLPSAKLASTPSSTTVSPKRLPSPRSLTSTMGAAHPSSNGEAAAHGPPGRRSAKNATKGLHVRTAWVICNQEVADEPSQHRSNRAEPRAP